MPHDELTPLSGLQDATTGPDLPMPPELTGFYGSLRLPAPPVRPLLFANFVSSLDGVVSLGEPGTGGKEISGGSAEDRAVMGLLRAAADVIVIGAGTLRSVPRHVWTPAAIYSPLADAYARLRTSLGRSEAPLTAVVTSTGDLDPSLPVFTSGRAPAAVVTSSEGAHALRARGGGGLDVRVASGPGPLDAARILAAIAAPASARVLLECGPRLMATFLDGGCVDELFLTLAPQVAGRARGAPREGFVAGALFLPDRPLWGELVALKQARSFLFLRYRFPTM